MANIKVNDEIFAEVYRNAKGKYVVKRMPWCSLGEYFEICGFLKENGIAKDVNRVEEEQN